MPTISVINESKSLASSEVEGFLAAFDQQWNKDLRSIWSVDSAAFAMAPSGKAPATGSWWLVFLDDSDQADALAYHDLTNEGLPISKIFVKTLQAAKASISVGATHELCEMAVDPWLNSAYQDPRGVFWAGEVSDPVESDRYGYMIGSVLVTDFVTPDWFAHQHSHNKMDMKGYAHTSFEVLSEGYAQKFDSSNGWVQVNGSKAFQSARVKAEKGSRRERRSRQTVMFERSDVRWDDEKK